MVYTKILITLLGCLLCTQKNVSRLIKHDICCEQYVVPTARVNTILTNDAILCVDEGRRVQYPDLITIPIYKYNVLKFSDNQCLINTDLYSIFCDSIDTFYWVGHHEGREYLKSVNSQWYNVECIFDYEQEWLGLYKISKK